MTKYAEECWQQYLVHRSALHLVQCVLKAADDFALRRNEEKFMVRTGTKALVDLSRELEPDRDILLTDIQNRADTWTSKTGGLWPWLKKNSGADVLDEKSRPMRYSIKNEFREANLSLFPQ